MDSPFGPKAIVPGLLPHRIERATPDRKRKGRSFEDELAGDHDEPKAHKPPAGTPPTQAPTPAKGQPDPDEEVGQHLDLEA